MITRLHLLVFMLCTWTSSGLRRAVEHGRILLDEDEGSETTEKAVLTAIVLAAALALGGTIAGVVAKYQGQIH